MRFEVTGKGGGTRSLAAASGSGETTTASITYDWNRHENTLPVTLSLEPQNLEPKNLMPSDDQREEH